MDGRAILPPLGIQSAEARATSVRERPRGGAAVASGEISGDSGAGQARRGGDPLGGRDGAAIRPPSGTLLGPAGSDARDSRYRQALRLQHDFHHHQPGATLFHGV